MFEVCGIGPSWDALPSYSRVSTFGELDDGIVIEDSVGMFCQEEDAAPVSSLGVS